MRSFVKDKVCFQLLLRLGWLKAEPPFTPNRKSISFALVGLHDNGVEEKPALTLKRGCFGQSGRWFRLRVAACTSHQEQLRQQFGH